MRLYVNTNEVPFLKDALEQGIHASNNPLVVDRLCDLLDRVQLCEELQKSERKAKLEEKVIDVNELYPYESEDGERGQED